MVEQNRSGAYTQFVYAPNGAKLAIFSGQTLQKAMVALPGGAIAVYNSSGLLYYGHSDHLGSIRFGSTPSRAMYFDLAYAPFGEQYAASGTTDSAFTGQRQDTSPGVYDFPDRSYSTLGRWPSPDPAGLLSVHLHDPQTLNRYAYVRNTALSLVDPMGLFEDCGDYTSDEEGDCGEGGGGGGGGGGGSGCDATDTSCGDNGGNPGNSGCDPADPTCGANNGGCTDSDPNCGGNNPPDPNSPHPNCNLGDPSCIGNGGDPTNPHPHPQKPPSPPQLPPQIPFSLS